MEETTLPQVLRGRRILVADDNRVRCQSLVEALTESGMRATDVTNGDGVQQNLYQGMDKNDPFTVVLTSQTESFTRSILRDHWLAGVSVVALTTGNSDQDHRLLELGFAGCLSTALSHTEFSHRLSQAVQAHWIVPAEAADNSDDDPFGSFIAQLPAQALADDDNLTSQEVALGARNMLDHHHEDSVSTGTLPPSFDPPSFDPPSFDMEALLERLMGNSELAEMIFDSLLQDIPQQLKYLSDFVEMGNLTDAREQIHSIKGAVSNVGAVTMCAVAHDMEKASTDGNFDGLKSRLPELNYEFVRLKDQVQAQTGRI